jgi:hypothetical protein
MSIENGTFYTDHPEVIQLCRKTYPDYNGKKFRVQVVAHPFSVSSYWDGGSHTYFTFVRLSDGASMPMPAQSAFDPKIKGADAVSLIPGMACIKHSIFCGKDTGCTVMVHPENAPKYLPVKVELTDDERTVLHYTASLKSCYAGDSNYRMHEAMRATKITQERWNAACVSCQSKGLLNKARAITQEGRNQR